MPAGAVRPPRRPGRGRAAEGRLAQGRDDQPAAGVPGKNGVPYSENAVRTEYFDPHRAYGTEWVTVTTLSKTRNT